MKNKEIEKIDEIYDIYEGMMTNKIVCHVSLWCLALLGISGFCFVEHASLFASTLCFIGLGLVYKMKIIVDKDIRKFREKYKEYHLPKSIININRQHKQEVKMLRMEQRKFKNDYIEKCDKVKREVTSPVRADLYYYEEPEKVKVKVKKR